jgi:hypothetical protein
VKRNGNHFVGDIAGRKPNAIAVDRASDESASRGSPGLSIARKTLPTVKVPPLDKSDPNYAKRRDELLLAAFSQIEHELIPPSQPLSDLAKTILKTPIGVAPK